MGPGMELLQFAYFNRQKDGVIGLDVVYSFGNKFQLNDTFSFDENQTWKS